MESKERGLLMRVEKIGAATLYLGDCREVMRTISKVDSVVTDPPYGVNLGNHASASDMRNTVLRKGGYESYDDTIENFDLVVVPAIQDALRKAARAAVWISDVGAFRLPKPDAIGGAFIPAAMGRNKWGFASLQHCLLYGTAPDLHLGAKATAFRTTETAEKNGHPCPKPLGWMKWSINIASRAGELILDPFMGSGTTGVAAVQMGRDFIGCEIEPSYFDIACKRIDDAQRQGDMFIENAA